MIEVSIKSLMHVEQQLSVLEHANAPKHTLQCIVNVNLKRNHVVQILSNKCWK